MKIRDYLCKCNMCDSILIDENPQVNAKKHAVDIENVAPMSKNNEGQWVCPVCGTDGYLTDYISDDL